MVKGVNRQIIEVNNTDSIYFEKAVFYLRPGVRRIPDELSSSEIDRIFQPMGCKAKKDRTLKIGRTFIYIAAAGVAVILFIVLK